MELFSKIFVYLFFIVASVLNLYCIALAEVALGTRLVAFLPIALFFAMNFKAIFFEIDNRERK